MKKEVKLEELGDFVKDFLKEIGNQNVFGLYGNLGSGKTTFTKEVAKQLGVKDEITSPTFTIMQSYEIPNSKFQILNFKKLVHIDLYRIEEPKELEVLKLDEIFNNKENLVFVEWAEKLQGTGNGERGTGKIEFDYNDEGSRIIEIKNE